VIRFIHSLAPATPEAIVRIEMEPGQQAQVDFGTVGMMWDPVRAALRTAYCFVMTLSWSRHMFVRFVFDQRIPTWLECHSLAFEYFGGVVRVVVIDNLKAAMLQASLDDPKLSEPYAQFARLYGFLVHPCRPRVPEHKGKVESGVHFVKRNFIASEQISDINDGNERVLAWVTEEAGLRVHGTTQARPMQRFLEVEQAVLQSLPAVPYDLELVVSAKLHRDCHLQADYAFYSAPWQHNGEYLDVYLYHQTVQIYLGTELLTSHERATHRGQRVTRNEHYPPDKTLYLTRTRSWCLERAAMVGPCCRHVVERLLSDGPLDRLRSVHGILGLADKWPLARVEKACGRAIRYGEVSCKQIKAILTAGTDALPAEKAIQLPLGDFTYARKANAFFTPEELGWDGDAQGGKTRPC